MNGVDELPASARSLDLGVGVAAREDAVARRIRAALAADGLHPLIAAATAEQIMAEREHGRLHVVVFGGQRSGSERAADIELVREQLRGVHAVVVSSTPGGRGVRKALKAGATGFVFEDQLEATLAVTVRAVCAGQVSIPSQLVHHTTKPALSPREKQILGMVVLGLQNQEIAAKLHLAEATVKGHLSATFKKLDVTSRKEAAALVLDHREGFGAGILRMPELHESEADEGP